MAKKLDPQQLVTVEELAIPSMWEIAALIEVLQRKGLLTKQELLDEIKELRRKIPETQAAQPAFPEPYLLTDAENAVIDRIFELINATGLTAHQAKALLVRVWRLIEIGERLGPKTMQ